MSAHRTTASEAPLPLKEALDRAMQFCSRKEYSSPDILQKILSWGCTLDDAHAVVAKLIEQKFLDDHRYAEAYVNDKLRFAKWGRLKIVYMLRMQGMEPTIIQEAVDRINPDQYLQCLQDELGKKRKSIKAAHPIEMKAKLFRFAAGRGFEPDVIQQALAADF
jgi:regulatory protein